MESPTRTAAGLTMDHRQRWLAALLPAFGPATKLCHPKCHLKFLKRQIATAPTLILRHGAWSLRFTREGWEEDLASYTH